MPVSISAFGTRAFACSRGGSVKPEYPTKEKSWQGKVILKLSSEFFSPTADQPL